MGNCSSTPPLVPADNYASSIWELFDSKGSKLLGKGASAAVYACTLKSNGTKYALKLLEKSDNQNAQLFEQEVLILKSLQHPCILSFVDCYETDDHYGISTQLLQGGEFFDRLQSMKHYSEREAAKLAKRMIQALSYCHKHDIVHRDLKPENYVFESNDANSEMKLIDFGCAKIVQNDTLYKDMAGTPYYIAPEILDQNCRRTGKILKAADMWSAGVIIYIMVTGTPPFNGSDDRAIMKAVAKGVYDWPKHSRISEALKDLISRLLKKNPLERLTSMEALEHPWIAGLEKISDESLGSDVMASLNDFSSGSKIKKAVANILVDQMTDQDVNKLRELFSKLDVDGDDLLDVHDVAAYMKKVFNYDDDTAKRQAASFIKNADDDGNGTIDVEEFSKAHMAGQLSVNPNSIRKAFEEIDKNGDGFLDSEEIEQLMKKSGGSSTVAIIKEIMQEVDENGDGKISFDEFLQSMQNKEKALLNQNSARGPKPE